MIINETVSQYLNSPVRQVIATVSQYADDTAAPDYTWGSSFSSYNHLKSLTIERIGDETKFFGYGICQKLNFHLRDIDRTIGSFPTSRRLRVSFLTEKINNVFCTPMFKVAQCRRDENTNELSITAYDALYRASEYTLADITLTAPYSMMDVVTAISNKLGLPLNTAKLGIVAENTLSYEEGANFDGTENLRLVLDYVAEATGSIYFIDYENNLTFKRLSLEGVAADYTIDRAQYITLESKDNRKLTTLAHITELGNNIEHTTGEVGTTQYIRDNPFWNNYSDSDISTYLLEVLRKVRNLTINQFNCSWRGNYLLEIGDKINLTTKDGKSVTSYILNDVISYDGTLSEETLWQYTNSDSETDTNPATLGDALRQTYAKVDKVAKEITLVASDLEKIPQEIAKLQIKTDEIEATVEALDLDELGNISEQLGALKITTDELEAKVESMEIKTEKIDEVIEMTEDTNELVKVQENKVGDLSIKTDSVTTSVERLETVTNEQGELIQEIEKKVTQTLTEDDVKIVIQQALNDGSASLTTSTGYTFDKDGLTISKTDSELSTQITDNGMTISKNGEAVLIANNVGVDAANLHATTYIIIGQNSRFQDYMGGTRTGLFWVGN